MIDIVEGQNRYAAHQRRVERVNREAWQLEEPMAAPRQGPSAAGASTARAGRFRLSPWVARPVTALRAALGLL